MAQDPSVVVAEAPPKASQDLKFLKVVIPLIALIVLLVLGTLYLPKLLNKSKITPRQTGSATTSPTNAVSDSIKKTFGGSAQYSDIIRFTNLAASEKDINKRYNYYLTVFNKISAAYVETQDPQFKLVLYKLQDYLKIYPQYKEEDAQIPD